jgi:Tfp pilus assembly protein PilN
VFLAILVVELIFMFVWYQRAQSDLDVATKRAQAVHKKIVRLNKLKKQWDAWQKEKKQLQAQMKVLEDLRYGQNGPGRMLKFFSYMLMKLPDTPQNLEELKAQELAGWDTRWDPRRVWLTRIQNQNGKIRMEGMAIDHGDVAEFYKRMESSAYVIDLSPGMQELSPLRDKLKLGFTPVKFTVKWRIRYTVPLDLAMETTEKKGGE